MLQTKLQTKTKVVLTVCALAWMVTGAIVASPVKSAKAASPVKAEIVVSPVEVFVPCPGNTCPEPEGTGASGSR